MLKDYLIEVESLSDAHNDTTMLRKAIISEQDAITLYELFASKTSNKKLKKLFKDVANEEKVHVGEFQSLLIELDLDELDSLEKGAKEQMEM